ncbi:MAG: 50S ribosomal protein L23 [Parcubacteria group bacterium GW2011_GWC2_38_7]|nr:MAG: 50S ribosomal protein L23 [Parcubacteria group bacterium GW2011_GWC2_38_7]
MSFLNKILNKTDDKDSEKKEPAVKVEKKQIEKSEKKEEVLMSHQNKTKKHEDPLAYRVITKPLITEKTTELAQLNKYVFVVPVTANKKSVAERIFGIYGVKPIKINIIKRPGKVVHAGRIFGRTKSYKKAIITLAVGEKIEVYEGV